MGSEWQKGPIGDFVDLSQGLAINKQTKHLLADMGYPLLRITDLLNDSYSQFINKEKAPQKCIANREEIIYTRTGQVGLVYKNKTGVVHNNCFKVVPKYSNLENKYLYWFLRQPSVIKYVNSVASGSVQKDLNHSAFKTIPFILPPLSEQKSIAHILGTLDDKIELNRKMNETLEEMAQALFKSWFVDFDPVLDNALAAGHEIPEALQANAEKRKALGEKRKALPQEIADLFPDRFVFTEELGWVPEGWEVSDLNQIVNVVSEKVNPEDVSKNLIYVGLEHIDRKNIFLSKNGDIQDVSSTKSYFGKHDILFGKLRPYFHKVCIAPEKGICSTDILVFSPKHEDSFAYSILNLFQPKLIETVNMASTGTRMPRANQKDILVFQIPLPAQDLICQFERMIFPNLLNGIENNKENLVLSDLRDSLLPKLISGELRLPESQKMLVNNV